MSGRTIFRPQHEYPVTWSTDRFDLESSIIDDRMVASSSQLSGIDDPASHFLLADIEQRPMRPVHPFHCIDHARGRPLESRIGFTLAMLMIFLGIPGGCSKEQMFKAMESAKAKTKSTSNAIEEGLSARGTLVLQTTPSTEAIGNLDLELISIGDSRANVVQILTYKIGSPRRSFPTVMLHGLTETTNPSSLVGQTVQCDMYYQASENSPIAITLPSESVAVTFESYSDDENTLAASIGSGTLTASDDTIVTLQSGKAVAAIRGEDN